MMDNQYYAEMLGKYIPWGSSTCSKHATLTPEEPAVIVSGKGCRVKDADGKEYIDFRNALGTVSLGYCREPVDDAIRSQLGKGIQFGYPSPFLRSKWLKGTISTRPIVHFRPLLSTSILHESPLLSIVHRLLTSIKVHFRPLSTVH